MLKAAKQALLFDQTRRGFWSPRGDAIVRRPAEHGNRRKGVHIPQLTASNLFKHNTSPFPCRDPGAALRHLFRGPCTER